MKLITVAVLTLAATAAFADGKATTEFYYEPAGGQQALQLNLDYMMDPMTYTENGLTGDAKTNSTSLIVNYGYGLSENMVVGGYLSYGSDAITASAPGGTDQTQTASGLGDIHLYFKGFSDMIHYGLDLGINNGNITEDSTTNLRNNNSSGGMSAKANVGFMMAAGMLNYGADLSYLYKGTVTTATAGGTNDTTTGDGVLNLSPFVEYNYGSGFAGAVISYSMVQSGNDTTTTSVATNAAYNVAGLKLFGTYAFSDSMTGLLSVAYYSVPSYQFDANSAHTTVAYGQTDVNLGFRMTF